MKRTYFALTIVGAMLCVSAFAGETTVTTAPPPSSACGTGWYFGLQGGANFFQDFGDDQSFVINGVDTVTIGMNDHIGAFGGIKFGYVFGQSDWRFALEEDWYYNGVDATATARLNGVEFASVDGMLNTAAFMTNLVLRYAPNGGCGFQPYIFGGIGGWFGETGGDIDVNVGGVTQSFDSSESGSGFAFQLGAGIDYYFNQKWSIFTEYKYLNYMNAGGDFTDDNVGQQLVGAGFKVHF